ncbi:CD9 antigen [Biomphalaria pfeifferi]|uniref:Tetraspanin n=2 Tax=Biomphalaria TaxID=6525 RepID=A0A2C9M652_BIOGL|nr:CD9 antigen [Biomphalaria glabrata]KAK0057319.1 CD9 antigen [Biomphalaria pfeifferi]
MGQYVGCVKYILFVFNFCLWLLGCALLSVGIWMKMDDSSEHFVQKYTEKEDEQFQISYSATGGTDVSVTISYLLIAFGVVLIVVTFIGCCGAVRENMCLLIVFAVCLFVLMVALIGVGSWAFVKKRNVEDEFKMNHELKEKTDQNIKNGVSTYYNSQTAKQFMDNVQKELRCCGTEAKKGELFAGYGKRIPHSCDGDTYSPQHYPCNYPYYVRVSQEISKFMKKRYTILSAVSFSFGFSLGLGMALAIILAVLIRRSTRLVVS